jgi:hypothetical protein
VEEHYQRVATCKEQANWLWDEVKAEERQADALAQQLFSQAADK